MNKLDATSADCFCVCSQISRPASHVAPATNSSHSLEAATEVQFCVHQVKNHFVSELLSSVLRSGLSLRSRQTYLQDWSQPGSGAVTVSKWVGMASEHYNSYSGMPWISLSMLFWVSQGGLGSFEFHRLLGFQGEHISVWRKRCSPGCMERSGREMSSSLASSSCTSGVVRAQGHRHVHTRLARHQEECPQATHPAIRKQFFLDQFLLD